MNAYPGNTYSLPIGVYGKDGKIGDVTSTVTIVAGGDNQAAKFPVSYGQLTVQEKGSATAAREGAVPDSTTFTVVGQPSGYSVSVNASGTVTVAPAANLGAGSATTARIKVTYPDTSYEYADVKIVVSDENGNTTPRTDRDAAKFKPTWAAVEMAGDETATAERSGNVPSGTTFTIREDQLGDLVKSIAFTIDETSGTLTITPKKPLSAGLQLNIPVHVAYPDGSAETLPVGMKVTADGQWQAQKASVEYAPITTPAGAAGTSRPKVDKVPVGTKFELGANLPEGWSGSVDKESGVLTVAAPRGGMKAEIPVKATFPDGSKQTYMVAFTTTSLAQTAPVKYGETTVSTGGIVTLSPSDFPEGTKFNGPNQDTNGIAITTNTDTGEITVAAASSAAAQTLDIPVRVTFPDQTVQDTTAKVTIQRATSTTPASPAPTSTSAQPTTTTPVTTPATTSTTQPSTTHRTTPTSTTPTTNTSAQAPVVLDVDWDDSDVLAGETVTINPKGSFPEGTKFSINGIRGWDVSIDENTGVISATIPAGTNPGSNASPIINVYAPNSSERIERRVKLTVGKQSEYYSPAYSKTTEIAGDEEATIKAAGGFPPATTFELVKPKSGTVWTIDVNESTGDITFKPTRPMRAGSSTTVEVRATFPDGSTTILEAGVAITEDAAALASTSTTPASTTAKPTPTPPKTTAKTTPTTPPKATKPTVTISTTITPTWTLPVPTDLPTTSKKPTTGNQTPTVPTPGTTTQTPTDTNSTDTNSADTNSADTNSAGTTQNNGSSGSSEGSSISTGGIIGIVVGVLALLGAAAAALGWWAAENGFLNF